MGITTPKRLLVVLWLFSAACGFREYSFFDFGPSVDTLSADRQEHGNKDQALTLSYTPENITTLLTQNVTLQCERRGDLNSTQEKVLWLRLVKKESSRWTTVASRQDCLKGNVIDERPVRVDSEIETSGGSGTLEVRWDIASPDTFGSYRCEAFGVGENGELWLETTNVVDINETITGESLIELWKTIKYGYLDSCLGDDDAQWKLLGMQTVEFGRQLEIYFRGPSPDQQAFKKALEKAQEKALEKAQEKAKEEEEEKEKMSALWLHGGHSLLKPESGCPEGFTDGSSSYFQLSMDKDNYWTCNYPVQGTSLSRPIRVRSGSHCRLQLRFCESTGTPKLDLPWPDGKYCVSKQQSNACPNDFQTGTLKMNFNYDAGSRWSGSTARGSKDYIYMDFCCKTTGSPATPIALPTEKPFYLYRYGGVCQEVKGMDVSVEHVDIYTQDEGYYDSLYGTHPDVSIRYRSPTKLQLCFYSKHGLLPEI